MDSREALADENPDALWPDGFEEAYIGHARRCGQPPLAAFSVRKCIEILMKRDGMTHEEAESDATTRCRRSGRSSGTTGRSRGVAQGLGTRLGAATMQVRVLSPRWRTMGKRKVQHHNAVAARALEAFANAARAVGSRLSHGLDKVADVIDAAAEHLWDEREPSESYLVKECSLCDDTGHTSGGWHSGPCFCPMGVLREEGEKLGIIKPGPDEEN